ncbi:hypothetical protein [uncultured Aliiroseovarius sp.]|uniref:hypothetical protein n=1 Tax=uncultured Aliiroseovarius sp. TaxID=1658783 RepID=UPI002594DDF0|nr:hypothetical protein [uncultured Aliiroseovarius sp.]
MTLGFSDKHRLAKLKAEMETWELYQVEIDKYHVMFWFENGHCLLNVAYRFEFESNHSSESYVYDVQATGTRKFLCVEPILREQVKSVVALDERRLALEFNQGKLIIHDSPKMRSAWFYKYDPRDHNGPLHWLVDDEESEEEW